MNIVTIANPLPWPGAVLFITAPWRRQKQGKGVPQVTGAPRGVSMSRIKGEPPAGGSPTLAYRNAEFLDSEEGRPLRILSEYLQPLHAFRAQRLHDTVVFFGSARLTEDGPMGAYLRDARELARAVTAWSMSLDSRAHCFVVCTGGGGGIMEAANRGATDAGGRTVGLNIGLPDEQRPNRYITPGLSLEFHYFFMRKL